MANIKIPQTAGQSGGRHWLDKCWEDMMNQWGLRGSCQVRGAEEKPREDGGCVVALDVGEHPDLLCRQLIEPMWPEESNKDDLQFPHRLGGSFRGVVTTVRKITSCYESGVTATHAFKSPRWKPWQCANLQLLLIMFYSTIWTASFTTMHHDPTLPQ